MNVISYLAFQDELEKVAGVRKAVKMYRRAIVASQASRPITSATPKFIANQIKKLRAAGEGRAYYGATSPSASQTGRVTGQKGMDKILDEGRILPTEPHPPRNRAELFGLAPPGTVQAQAGKGIYLSQFRPRFGSYFKGEGLSIPTQTLTRQGAKTGLVTPMRSVSDSLTGKLRKHTDKKMLRSVPDKPGSLAADEAMIGRYKADLDKGEPFLSVLRRRRRPRVKTHAVLDYPKRRLDPAEFSKLRTGYLPDVGAIPIDRRIMELAVRRADAVTRTAPARVIDDVLKRYPQLTKKQLIDLFKSNKSIEGFLRTLG